MNTGSFPQALDNIATKTALSDPQPEAQEGIAASPEKRPPRFNQWID